MFDHRHWSRVDALCAKYTLALQGELVAMDRRLRSALLWDRSAHNAALSTDAEIKRIRDLLVRHGDTHLLDEIAIGGDGSRHEEPDAPLTDDEGEDGLSGALAELTSLELRPSPPIQPPQVDTATATVAADFSNERDALARELREAVAALESSSKTDEQKRELFMRFVPVGLLSECGIDLPTFLEANTKPPLLNVQDLTPDGSSELVVTSALLDAGLRRHTRQPSLSSSTAQHLTPRELHVPPPAPLDPLESTLPSPSSGIPPPALDTADAPPPAPVVPSVALKLRFTDDVTPSPLTRLPGGRALQPEEAGYYFSLSLRRADRERLSNMAEKALQQLRKERLDLISATSQFGSLSGGDRLRKLEKIQAAEGLVAKAEEVCSAIDAESLEFQEHKATMMRLANAELKAVNGQYDSQTNRISNAEGYLTFVVDRELDALRRLNSRDDDGGMGSASASPKPGKLPSSQPGYGEAAFMRSRAYCTVGGVWKADVALQVRDVSDHAHASTMQVLTRIKEREDLIAKELGTISEIARQAAECDEMLDSFIACPKCKTVSTNMLAMWPCGHPHCATCFKKAQQHLHMPSGRRKATGLRRRPSIPQVPSGALHPTGHDIPEAQSEVASLLAHLVPSMSVVPQPPSPNPAYAIDVEDSLVYRCPTCGDHSSSAPIPHLMLNSVAGRMRFHRSGYEDLSKGLARYWSAAASIDQQLGYASLGRYHGLDSTLRSSAELAVEAALAQSGHVDP